MKKPILLSCLLLSFLLKAQVPAPAPAQQGKIYIINATAHTGDGKVMNNAVVGFENGKIVFLQEDPTFKTDETMGRIINAQGRHVYPGLIAMNTKMGLSEIEAVRATNDFAEVGNFNPNARAIIAYNTDSRVTPTVRSNGVLLAQTVPQGGTVSGTSAVVQLDAWNWEDALVKEDGIWLNWPSMIKWNGWWAEPAAPEANKEYDKQVNEVKAFFDDAKSYSDGSAHDKTNLRMESMRDLFGGKKSLYINVNAAKEIQHAIAFAARYGVVPVICGGREAYQIADELAQKKVAVVLDNPHSLPANTDDDVDQPFKTPAQLQKAGVLFAISIPGGFWQERNLSYNAGTAAAYGLSKEQALASITANPAKILKLDNQLGTLAVGKDATLFISEGDVLDMRSSTVTQAFVNGREIDLNNKQKMLNEKFSKKYGVKP